MTFEVRFCPGREPEKRIAISATVDAVRFNWIESNFLTLHERFASHYPGVFYLDVYQCPEIESYLGELRWLGEAEYVIRAEPAGSGNMNTTVRVFTDARSFILKQSRPWVAKYPDIAAPWDRALVEGYFYEW